MMKEVIYNACLCHLEELELGAARGFQICSLNIFENLKYVKNSKS